MFAAIILGLCRVCELLSQRSGIVLAWLLFLAGITMNLQDNQIFLNLLNETGGRGRFSSAYNDFAGEACLDPEKTDKIYVFPEWGFYANFVYLTSNQCKAIRDADIDISQLQEYLNNGRSLVLVAEKEQAAEELLGELTYDEASKKVWLSKERKEIFVSVEIK